MNRWEHEWTQVEYEETRVNMSRSQTEHKLTRVEHKWIPTIIPTEKDFSLESKGQGEK